MMTQYNGARQLFWVRDVENPDVPFNLCSAYNDRSTVVRSWTSTPCITFVGGTWDAPIKDSAIRVLALGRSWAHRNWMIYTAACVQEHLIGGRDISDFVIPSPHFVTIRMGNMWAEGTPQERWDYEYWGYPANEAGDTTIFVDPTTQTLDLYLTATTSDQYSPAEVRGTDFNDLWLPRNLAWALEDMYIYQRDHVAAPHNLNWADYDGAADALPNRLNREVHRDKANPNIQTPAGGFVAPFEDRF